MGKPITGKTLGKTYKRRKDTYNTEESALNSILKENPKERKKNLKPAHTKVFYRWKAKSKLD